jgi:hypothetical protein
MNIKSINTELIAVSETILEELKKTQISIFLLVMEINNKSASE